MAVTGFEIFGAVGTSIALLNMARQGFESLKKDYKAYKNYGQSVAKSHRSCEQVYYLIEEWSSFWDLNVQRSDEWYKAYWNERGWEQIQQQLAAVLIQCGDLAAVIDKALPENNYSQISGADKIHIKRHFDERALRVPRQHHPDVHPTERFEGILRNGVKNDWAAKTIDIRVLEEHITNATTVRKKVMYILSSCDQLQTYLKDLEEEFKKLERLAKTAWRSRHGTDYRVSSKSGKRIIALTETHKYVLREARADRMETKALHHCCISTPDNLKLELSLLDSSPAENKFKVFRIFVPQPGGKVHLEMIARIFRKHSPTNEDKVRPNFSSACKEVHKGGQCLWWTSPGVMSDLAVPRQKTWFSVSRTIGADYQEELPMLSLSLMLRDMTMGEKLELAYSIVESSLILLGTPWLSALSSHTLKQYRTENGQPPRYVFSIKEKAPGLVRNHFQLEKGPLESFIFGVGTLLVEIALGKVVQNFRKTAEGRQFVITEHDNDTTVQRSCSLRLIVSKVDKAMGKSYSEAAGFCLRDPWEPGTSYDSSFNEEEQAMEVLEMCFNNILVKSVSRIPA